MYISPRLFRSTFLSILQKTGPRSTCGIVLFVSTLDVDALCACKCLAAVLKQELVSHKIVPVVGYSDLKSYYTRLDDDVSVVVLFGCGATVDLEEFLDPEGSSSDIDRAIYIIDNHRPWNLDNVFGSKLITCVDDGYIDESLLEHKLAYEFLVDDDDDEDDDEDEVDEEQADDNRADFRTSESNENDSNRDNNTNSIQNNNNDDSNGSNTNNINENDDSDSDSESIRAPKRSLGVKQLRSKYSQMLEDYYGKGTYIRSCCSVQTYAWISSVGRTSIDGLWLLIVGTCSLLTSRYPHLRTRLIETLQDETNRQNAISDIVTTEMDYALFLLKHWSIYESIMHSSYTASRLKLWTPDGKRKMHKMLARMGVPLIEAKEHWIHTQMDVKKTLQAKLSEIAIMYGIPEIIRPGFVRRYGYKGSISGSDCADILAAILSDESELVAKILHVKTMREQNAAAANGDTTNGAITEVDANVYDENKMERWKNDFWTDNFWRAWDALDNVDKLLKSADQAKEMQKIIVATSNMLLEKKALKNLRAYHLIVVREGPDLEKFQNPLLLSRLGVWIGETIAEIYSSTMPLIIAALSPEKSSFLVLGMTSMSLDMDDKSAAVSVLDSDVPINKFGISFRQTALSTNADIKMDAFDSSIIEIDKRDLSRFLESLTLSMMV